MSWETELQDASFRGVPFECISTDDVHSKTLAIHQSPYSDDAEIEDIGNDPRKVSIQAVFAGETYLSDYHKLEAALNERGAGELVHPIFGILNVQVVSHTVHHDEQSYDSCMISIEFIKAKADKKEVFLDAELMDGINLESVLENPASALDLALEKLKVLDNNKYISAINNIRTGLQNVYKYMGIGKGFIENILSPSAWSVGLIDDITKILTFDTNISAISKWRDLNNRTKNISSFFKSDDEDTPAELNDLAKTLHGKTAKSIVIATSNGAINVTVGNGETCVYDQHGHTLWLKADGTHIGGGDLIIDKGNLKVNGKVIAAQDIESAGQISDSGGSMQSMRDTYNSHEGHSSGGKPSNQM